MTNRGAKHRLRLNQRNSMKLFMEWEQRCEQRKECPSHKVPFKKRAQAQGEAARQEQNYYRCRDCGQYHLTTQGDGVGIELKPAAKY